MSEKVTTRQRIAVQTYLEPGSVASAAEAAGVTRQTFHRWRKQDRFKQMLAEAEQEALESLSRALVRLGDKATATLEGAMDGAEKESTKVRAADIVLSRLLQLRELVTLEERVSELEKRLQARKPDA